MPRPANPSRAAGKGPSGRKTSSVYTPPARPPARDMNMGRARKSTCVVRFHMPIFPFFFFLFGSCSVCMRVIHAAAAAAAHQVQPREEVSASRGRGLGMAAQWLAHLMYILVVYIVDLLCIMCTWIWWAVPYISTYLTHDFHHYFFLHYLP